MNTAESRIFVVDDEPIIARTLQVILRQNGFAVSSFTDPLELLEQLDEEMPHVVISDVMMPGLSGVDLAVQIKQRYPSCKILLFSGAASAAELLIKASGLGHQFRLLSKPVHPTDLLQNLREMTEA